jgi:hypothetical protein
VALKHRTVEFEARQAQPGRWRWIIQPPQGRAVVGPAKFATRERAVEACIEEINNGIERGRRSARKAPAKGARRRGLKWKRVMQAVAYRSSNRRA